MWLKGACVLTALAVAGCATPAGANGKGHHDLIRQHQCVSMKKPLQPPIAGYLIRDTAQPKSPLFYKSVDVLTAGFFVGMGGTWQMVYWCKK